MQSQLPHRISFPLDRKGPVLLPRYWWLSFAFGVPFILAACLSLMLTGLHHVIEDAELAALRGALVGLGALCGTALCYAIVIARLRRS